MLGTGTVTNRREARVVALQVLCEVDVVRHEAASILDELFSDLDIMTSHSEFISDLVENVLVNIEELDNIITDYAPSWPIWQIAVVDRNIIRLAVAEIKWLTETPEGAVINEAVELAKAFGAEGSPGFVNGVLGSFVVSVSKSNS